MFEKDIKKEGTRKRAQVRPRSRKGAGTASKRYGRRKYEPAWKANSGGKKKRATALAEEGHIGEEENNGHGGQTALRARSEDEKSQVPRNPPAFRNSKEGPLELGGRSGRGNLQKSMLRGKRVRRLEKESSWGKSVLNGHRPINLERRNRKRFGRSLRVSEGGKCEGGGGRRREKTET